MKRILTLVFIACLTLLLAAPASAQRDPFDPEGGDGGGSNQQQQQNDDADQDDDDADDAGAGNQQNDDAAQPAVETNTSTDVLPLTGSAAETWFVIAYALVVLGLSLLAYNRLGPPAHGRLKRRT